MTDMELSAMVEVLYEFLKNECNKPFEAAEVLINVHVDLYLNNRKDNSNIDEYIKVYVKLFKEAVEFKSSTVQ